MSRKGRKASTREPLRRVLPQEAWPAAGWLSLSGGLLAALAVSLGLFEAPLSLHALVVLALVAAGGSHQLALRWRGSLEEAGFARQVAGPLWWLVAVWSVYRLLLPVAPQAIVLPAAFTAWLAASSAPLLAVLPLLTGAGMETGLALLGHQSWWNTGLDLLACAAAVTIFTLYARSKVYRKRVRQAVDRARQAARRQEYATDLGLSAGPSLEALIEPQENGSPVVEAIAASFDLQLELLRRALHLTTVAVLWPDAEKQELRLRSLASSRDDVLPGPYPLGGGIAGALRHTGDLVTMVPVRADYQGLPYYRSAEGVGGVLACRIPGSRGRQEEVTGLLCVDRTAASPWGEEEIRVLQLAARKVSLEVSLGRRLEVMDRERQAGRQIYLGLRELNAVLGLEAVCGATIRVVESLVEADFCAIGLVEKDRHRIAHGTGREAARLVGSEFPVQEGLAGQVLKARRSLPAGGSYPGAAPVFSSRQRLGPFGSLLILPLCKEDGEPVGTLTVAAEAQQVFTDTRRQLLELVANQVAIKIDLARAHERINSLATTDGLTGLANHRTLQHGLEVMLYRAERRKSPLCVLLGDIDYFKGINDTYGHPFGDQVLQAVAAILSKAVRRVDLAARYGGEEFAIILEDSNRRNGLRTAERIRAQIAELVLRHDQEQVRVTMSMGLAVYPENGEQKRELIARADQALYQAKQNGRNQVVAWQKAGLAPAGETREAKQEQAGKGGEP